ncbi:hypothetical protein [Exiguobacterium sp. s142]|uniref:hypothetical protein n=1 Tax=Exiguobacterium sp. s142 TaxID=2751222 RepID=UPI001BE74ECB
MVNKRLVFFIFIFLILQIFERIITYNIFGGSFGEYFISTIFLAFFIFLLTIRNPSFGKNTFLTKWGRNSVGIFLIHPLVISLYYLIVNNLGINLQQYFIFHLLFTPLVFLLSYFIYSFKKNIIISPRKLIFLNKSIEENDKNY